MDEIFVGAELFSDAPDGVDTVYLVAR